MTNEFRGEFGDIHRARVAGTFDSTDIPSPIDAAAAMTMPVLLIHGKRDFTVPVGHSTWSSPAVMGNSRYCRVQSGKPALIHCDVTV